MLYMHEKPLPGVESVDIEVSPTVIETEGDYDVYMTEPGYGFDPDYDPVPDDIETDDIYVHDTDIPF